MVAETGVDSLDGGGTMAGMERDRPPYDPKDPYWLFKEVTAFEREFHAKVEVPLLAAMFDRVDQMWQDAIDTAKPPEVK
jgi:hypothetical protein